MEKSLEIKLPADYKDFMLSTNGYEGWIGEHYLIFWKVEEIAENNEGYNVKEFAPQMLIFGSDGGGEAYAFDKNKDFKIVKIPFIPMDPAAAIDCGKDFTEFLNNLLTKESLFDNT